MTADPAAPIVIVWFRNDLRLADNPALAAAVARGARVLPLFVLEDGETTAGDMAPGAASRWWLHHSLTALADGLAGLGAPLHLRRGDAAAIVPDLARRLGASAVTWCRRYEPRAVARDRTIKAELADAGISAESFNGTLLYEPWEVRTKDGGAYGVFTPFWKAECALGDPPPPGDAPAALSPAPTDAVGDGERLADWGLTPTAPDWAGGLRAAWTPGEPGARARLAAFLEDGVAAYPDRRDRPDLDGTSRLSAHLHFGELSARQVWHFARERARAAGDGRVEAGVWAFLREVAWRDFNHNLLFHTPGMETANYQRKFDRFPWADDETLFRAWAAGRTGYPIVDAGMRELWETGYMHNRVRMVAASFLVKDLLIPWQRGEAWFRDTLVDADLANNVANWQWVAGSGADAAPYFRIFNPVTQGQRFDPAGHYVRRFVPELAALPTKALHAPWTADAATLDAAGVELGATYPHPVVDHKTARQRALAAYEDIKGAA